MAKKNVMCVERLYSEELMHAETSAAKRQYNREYYQAHKQYWKDYYKTGHGIGRKPVDASGMDDGNREKRISDEIAVLKTEKIPKLNKSIEDLEWKYKTKKISSAEYVNQRANLLKEFNAASKKLNALESDAQMLFDKGRYENGSDGALVTKDPRTKVNRPGGGRLYEPTTEMKYKDGDWYIGLKDPVELKPVSSPKSKSISPYAKIKNSERKYKKSGGSGRW